MVVLTAEKMVILMAAWKVDWKVEQSALCLVDLKVAKMEIL